MSGSVPLKAREANVMNEREPSKPRTAPSELERAHAALKKLTSLEQRQRAAGQTLVRRVLAVLQGAALEAGVDDLKAWAERHLPIMSRSESEQQGEGALRE